MTAIEDVVTRAMSDSAFANAIVMDPESALAAYSLSTDEITLFREMTRIDFQAFLSAHLEERKSFSMGHSLGETFVYVRDEGG